MSRIWYTRCPAPTPFGITVQKGWLQEEFAADGIDIKALQDADDVSIRRSHFTHSQPWSFRQGGNIPALWARAQGSDTRLIGLSWVDEFQALITLDRDLTLAPAAIARRRFGLPRNTHSSVVDFHRATALRGISSLLDAADVPFNGIDLVDLPHTPRGLEDVKPPDEAPIGEWLASQRTHEFAREAQALLRGEADIVFVKGATGSTSPICSTQESSLKSAHKPIARHTPTTVRRARLPWMPNCYANGPIWWSVSCPAHWRRVIGHRRIRTK